MLTNEEVLLPTSATSNSLQIQILSKKLYSNNDISPLRNLQCVSVLEKVREQRLLLASRQNSKETKVYSNYYLKRGLTTQSSRNFPDKQSENNSQRPLTQINNPSRLSLGSSTTPTQSGRQGNNMDLQAVYYTPIQGKSKSDLTTRRPFKSIAKDQPKMTASRFVDLDMSQLQHMSQLVGMKEMKSEELLSKNKNLTRQSQIYQRKANYFNNQRVSQTAQLKKRNVISLATNFNNDNSSSKIITYQQQMDQLKSQSEISPLKNYQSESFLNQKGSLTRFCKNCHAYSQRVKNLEQRLIELENENNYLQQQLNEDMKTELQSQMKGEQKSNASAIHNFYQNVFLTGMKSEMQMNNDLTEELKQEVNDLKGEVFMLKKKNAKLQKQVDCYRNILIEKDYSKGSYIKNSKSQTPTQQRQGQLMIKHTSVRQNEYEFDQKLLEVDQSKRKDSFMQEILLPISRESSIKAKRSLPIQDSDFRGSNLLQRQDSIEKKVNQSPGKDNSSQESPFTRLTTQLQAQIQGVNENAFLKQFIKIDKLCAKLNNASSWDEFFHLLEDGLIEIYNQAQVRILMVDKDMQNLYKDEKNRSMEQKGEMNQGLTTCYFLDEVRYLLIQSIKNQQRFPSQKVKPPSFLNLNKGLYSKHVIAFPIISTLQCSDSNRYPLIYLQIENMNTTFTRNDEVTASHFKLFLAAILEKLFFCKFYYHLKETQIKQQKLFKSLVQKKTHIKIQKEIQATLPDLFEFKKVNVLYKDPFNEREGTLCFLKEEQFEQIDITKPQEYSEQLIRVPCDVGMTGRAIKERKILLCEKGSYDPRFRFESDNPLDITHISNFIIAPLISYSQAGEAKVMGVLQLFNKTSSDVIHDIDLELLGVISQTLTSVLESAEELHQSWMIIYQLKEQVTKLMNGVKQGAFTVESQEKVFKEANKSLFDANVAVKQLVNSKKSQFISELVTLKNSEFILKSQKHLQQQRKSKIEAFGNFIKKKQAQRD